jgi:hypothetical protein
MRIVGAKDRQGLAAGLHLQLTWDARCALKLQESQLAVRS